MQSACECENVLVPWADVVMCLRICWKCLLLVQKLFALRVEINRITIQTVNALSLHIDYFFFFDQSVIDNILVDVIDSNTKLCEWMQLIGWDHKILWSMNIVQIDTKKSEMLAYFECGELMIQSALYTFMMKSKMVLNVKDGRHHSFSLSSGGCKTDEAKYRKRSMVRYNLIALHFTNQKKNLLQPIFSVRCLNTQYFFFTFWYILSLRHTQISLFLKWT